MCNSALLVNFVGNSYLSDDIKSDNVDKKLPSTLTSDNKARGLGQFKLLNDFWKRLIFRPTSFPQNPNSNISNILEEETGMMASESIKSVLSNHLDLPIESKNLSEIINNTFKIFHEDFPFDFILEYNGKRLGMMLLDRCNNSNGEEKLIYRFQPHIKNFRGLF